MKKEGNKKMPTPRHKVTHNPIPTSLLTVPVLTRSYLPIPTSLFLSRSYPFYVGIVYKWKNHFYEMKGDVGMSLHEKERNKKMPTPRHKVTHNPIPTSLFCFNMLFVCLL